MTRASHFQSLEDSYHFRSFRVLLGGRAPRPWQISVVPQCGERSKEVSHAPTIATKANRGQLEKLLRYVECIGLQVPRKINLYKKHVIIYF